MVRRSFTWQDENAFDGNGFQLAEPPKADPASAGNYVSTFEEEMRRRQSLGPVPEKAGASKTDGAVAGPSKGKSAPREPGYTPEREEEAIRRLDPVIRQEQLRLHRMTSRYKKQYKIVKEVDDYFFSLPRYRDVYVQYHKDRNLFAFCRKAVALPEVRAGVKKYMLNGEAMRVGMMMLAEGLRQPVPQPVMQETMTFINKDHDVARYMGTEFWPLFTSQMPNALASAPLPPGAQTAVQRLTSALSGASAPAR